MRDVALCLIDVPECPGAGHGVPLNRHSDARLVQPVLARPERDRGVAVAAGLFEDSPAVCLKRRHRHSQRTRCDLGRNGVADLCEDCQLPRREVHGGQRPPNRENRGILQPAVNDAHRRAVESLVGRVKPKGQAKPLVQPPKKPPPDEPPRAQVLW